MGRLAAALLALTSACSFAHTRAPITASTPNPTCSNNRAKVDAVAGTGLMVGGTFAGTYAAIESDSPLTMVGLGIAIAGAGAVFLASAIHGWRDDALCERELIAAQTPPTPLHAEPPNIATMTCEQRRLDMYTRAVTGADQDQRVRLLTELPSCEERSNRERAWALARMASLDAGAGHCDEIESIARQVFDLDVALHDVVLMGDIEVRNCLTRREL